MPEGKPVDLKRPDPFKNAGPSDPGIQIRAVGPGDNEYLERLSAQVFSPFGSYGAAIRDWLDSGEALALLALVHGRPAGFAMTSLVRPYELSLRGTELLAIAVTPEEQRAGIGRRLLRLIQVEARNHDADLILLHTATGNLAARALFEAEGFRAVRLRPAFYPMGQDALLMLKNLPRK